MPIENLEEQFQEITRLFSQARFVWQTNKKHFHKTEEQPKVDNRIVEINHEIENVAEQMAKPNFYKNRLKSLKQIVQMFSDDMKERALLIWKEKSVNEILIEFLRERREYEEGARKRYSKDVQKILDKRIDKILEITQKLQNADMPLAKWKASLKKTKDLIDFFLNNMKQIRNAKYQMENTGKKEMIDALLDLKKQKGSAESQKVWKKMAMPDPFYWKYNSPEQAVADTQETFELEANQVFVNEPLKENGIIFSKQMPHLEKTKTSSTIITSTTPRTPSTTNEITPSTPSSYKP